MPPGPPCHSGRTWLCRSPRVKPTARPLPDGRFQVLLHVGLMLGTSVCSHAPSELDAPGLVRIGPALSKFRSLAPGRRSPPRPQSAPCSVAWPAPSLGHMASESAKPSGHTMLVRPSWQSFPETSGNIRIPDTERQTESTPETVLAVGTRTPNGKATHGAPPEPAPQLQPRGQHWTRCHSGIILSSVCILSLSLSLSILCDTSVCLAPATRACMPSCWHRRRRALARGKRYWPWRCQDRNATCTSLAARLCLFLCAIPRMSNTGASCWLFWARNSSAVSQRVLKAAMDFNSASMFLRRERERERDKSASRTVRGVRQPGLM